jgi:mono/diheme cytochrome c family protein
MKKHSLLIGLLLALVSSCYYDAADEIYPDDPCDLTDITYSKSVAPIINRQCNICHNSRLQLGGVTLETYPNIKNYVDNGILIQSILHIGTAQPMPKGGDQLSECNINIIRTWLDAGAPNN